MMKSEEMKRKKFEILVKDIDEYLGRTKTYKDGDIFPLDFFIEKSENNQWLISILNNTFTHLERSKQMDCSILSFFIEKDNIMELVKWIRDCDSCGGKGKNCHFASHLLFWLIFTMAVDNENYNNNLSVVSDVAFVLDFDEDMLKDWITAVKGVLSGKKLPELEYKTEAGKAFFVR